MRRGSMRLGAIAVMESPGPGPAQALERPIPIIRRFRQVRELIAVGPVIRNGRPGPEVPAQEPGSEKRRLIVPSWDDGGAMSVTEHHPASTADQRRWEAVLEIPARTESSSMVWLPPTFTAGLRARHAGPRSAG